MNLAAPAAERHRAMLRRILPVYFEDLEESLFDALLADLTIRDVAAGDVLFRQDEPSGDLYFVLRGRLRAVRVEDGRARVLGEIARGETIGELSLFTGEPRSATIVALRPSTVARLTRPDFERILSLKPSIAIATARLVIDRFRRAERVPARRGRAATICLAPLTPGVDARALGAALADALRALGDGGVGLLAQAEAEDGLDRAEHHYDTLILIADDEPTDWTRRATQAADDILLVADARADQCLTGIERSLIGENRGHAVARRSLVLLHAPETRAPSGAAHWLDSHAVDRHFHLRRGAARDLARLARALAGRSIGMVMSGGGARGFAHVGVLRALEEAGIEPDQLGGSSMGAIIASFPACDLRGRDLVEAVRAVFDPSPTRDYNLLPMTALLRGRRARTACERTVIGMNGALIDIEDCWRPYFLVASDITHNAEAVLRRGSLARALRATFSIPGVFPPVPVDGRLMVDGALCNNFPVDVMEQQGVAAIIGSDVLAENAAAIDGPELPPDWRLLIDRLRPREKRRWRVPGLIDLLVNAPMLGSAARQREMRRRVDFLVRPDAAAFGHLDWGAFDAIVAQGYEAARRALDGAEATTLAKLR
ncbi:MAG: patatin-like phospholipase family protein [Methylobacteriaceae bacterium]|nr:patatin-like phospholipase family protein [Methylobacteriaceae bacterium]